MGRAGLVRAQTGRRGVWPGSGPMPPGQRPPYLRRFWLHTPHSTRSIERFVQRAIHLRPPGEHLCTIENPEVEYAILDLHLIHQDLPTMRTKTRADWFGTGFRAGC